MPRRYELFAIALCACAAAPAFTAGDERAVRAVLDAQRDAWNRANLEGYMAGYFHDASIVFTSGGNIRRGWQETHDKYVAKYGGSAATMGHLGFDILSIQPLGADGAIVLGRWRLTDTPNAGAGVFSVAFARTPGGWRIVHDHTSLAPTAP